MRFKTAQPVAIEPRGLPGPPGVSYLGSWNARSTYPQRAVVLYQRAQWYATRGSTGIVPGSNPTFWTLFLPQGVKGDKGDTPTLEYRQTSTHLQIRRVGDENWIDALALDAIRGNAPELQWRQIADRVQVRRVGDTAWSDLVLFTAITGPQGPIGPPGPAVVAWTTGMTATVNYPYAYQNKVWRAKTATATDPVAGANWEYLYDTVAGAHNHDDLYYRKTESDGRYPAVGNVYSMAQVDAKDAATLAAAKAYALQLVHSYLA